MEGSAIQQIARQSATELPEVERVFPFGPEHEVFRVGGRIFCMTTDATGESLTTLKCDPDHSILLRSTYPAIFPGWHVNKRHWVSIRTGQEITPDLVEDLVMDAYALVVEKLPKSKRPALPDGLRLVDRMGD